MKIKHSLTGAFRYAFAGCVSFFTTERNGRIQLLIALSAIIISVVTNISAAEWCIVLLCIGLVISLEMINSAIEKLCDKMQTGYDPVIKVVKDIAAGAVLWASLISVIIGLLIFIPKILK